jgi:exodeoxyribonuclease VII large subunit
MELIEKAEAGDSIIAKIKGTIWSFTYRMIAPYFETTTGYRLAAGLKVMIRVQPDFHEVYGISLTIKDIDPTYTLGDLARIRREILRRLQTEGVIDMNRMLPFPLVPQRIAVISSETAAGYGDFMDTLIHNNYSYAFSVELFQALVQGERAPESIISALDRIYEREDEFDLVVIIRGGGAQSDLDCFNNYDLVYHITQFPLPVISGIGHERDETITDIVAHTSVKTPTAVAEFLINAVLEFDNLLESFSEQLAELAGTIITQEKDKLFQLSQNTVFLVHENLNEESNRLTTSNKRLGLLTKQFTNRKQDILENHKYRVGLECGSMIKSNSALMENAARRLQRGLQSSFKIRNEQLLTIEKNLEYLRPEKVLLRGYSISSSGGKLVKDASALKEGDELTTRFFKGVSISVVKKTNQL